MTSEMFAGLTVEDAMAMARRRAEEIMEEGKDRYTPSSTAEILECIVLVSAGHVTDIEVIQFSNIDLSEVTSQQMSLLLGVVTNAVVLVKTELSTSQTEAVFSSMSGLSVGISLWDGAKIDVAAATEALRGLTRGVRGKEIVCYGDSRYKYRQGMGQWARVLGWRYQECGPLTEIVAMNGDKVLTAKRTLCLTFPSLRAANSALEQLTRTPAVWAPACSSSLWSPSIMGSSWQSTSFF